MSGDVHGSCTKVSAFEVETNPSSVSETQSPRTISWSGSRATATPLYYYRREETRERAEIERESFNFMEHHLDEGMKEVC